MTPVQWKWHFTYLRKACYKLYDCYWLFVCFKCLNDCLNYENVSKCDNYLIDAFFYSNVYLLYKTVHTCTMYYERIINLLNYFDIYQTVFFMFLFSAECEKWKYLVLTMLHFIYSWANNLLCIWNKGV